MCVTVITNAYSPIGSTKSLLLDRKGLFSEGGLLPTDRILLKGSVRSCNTSQQQPAFRRASCCRALISPAGAALLCDLRCFHNRLYAFIPRAAVSYRVQRTGFRCFLAGARFEMFFYGVLREWETPAIFRLLRSVLELKIRSGVSYRGLECGYFSFRRLSYAIA